MNNYDCTLVKIAEHEGTITESVLKSFRVQAWSYYDAVQEARTIALPGHTTEYLRVKAVGV